MARIVVTGTSARAVGNWLPAFDHLVRLGHRVETILFPNLSDPDHLGLDALSLPRLADFPIPQSLRRIDWETVSNLAAAAHDVLARDVVAGVVLTTCHAGPEKALAERLFRASQRPVIIGCQHGTVQRWSAYWDNFTFDEFLVFGEAFRESAPDALRSRVHATGLPKLDVIVAPPRPPFTLDGRPILFAAQTTRTDEIICRLHALALVSGREVRVRPHPEFPGLFADSGFKVMAPGQPLLEQMAECSLVITSGSTTVLEALVAGCPCVVLPLEHGDAYTAAGIVATAGAPEEILAIAARQQQQPGRQITADFLARTVGTFGSRATERAAMLIATLVQARTSQCGEAG